MTKLRADPASVQLGTHNITMTYQNVPNYYEVKQGGLVTAYLRRDPTLDKGQLQAFSDRRGSVLGFAARTTGSEVAMAATGAGFGAGYESAFVRRTATTGLPTTGTASYSGDYAGVIRDKSTTGRPVIENVINGDVRLNANFGANRISGVISNRTVRGAISNAPSIFTTSADLMINPSTIKSDGSFDMNLFGWRF